MSVRDWLRTAVAVWLMASGAAAEAPAGEGASGDAARWLEATATVESPAGAVLAVLLDWEAYPDWYPGLARMRVLERREAGAVVHGLHTFPWPFRDRDYVVAYRLEERAGGIALTARSIRGPSGAGPESGAVRLEDVESRFELEALPGSRTRVRYAVRDVSSLPEWWVRRRFESTWAGLLDGLSRASALREASGQTEAGSG
ncbi:MAG: START domain-containing protein [Myxococcota bacterium]|nr:START domain-containing protein [Myxococcota bacterium]